MPDDNLLVHFYSSARNELIERIRLRDQVLLAYLGAAGALFAFAFGKDGRMDALVVMPYLALGAALFVQQHNDVIGSLSLYCKDEIGPYLGDAPPHWDASKALGDYLDSAVRLRTWGNVAVVLTPSIGAMALTYQLLLTPIAATNVFLWAGGCLATFVTTLLFWFSHRRRKRLARAAGEKKPREALASPNLQPDRGETAVEELTGSEEPTGS